MKLINTKLLEQLIQDAASSPRQRSHYNIHESLADTVQKLVVAATPKSYFRPHRHDDKTEFALVLRGRFAVFQFDEEGAITEYQIIGEDTDTNGLEIPANTWHSWLALRDENVFFETKQGPYDPATAAEFASWAPEENSPEANDYIEKLRKAI
ncbi:MAG: WbuC family cupin fold metalloprotein [Gammaproteobacteria bacterium]